MSTQHQNVVHSLVNMDPAPARCSVGTGTSTSSTKAVTGGSAWERSRELVCTVQPRDPPTGVLQCKAGYGTEKP